jgi:FixJ family two-component response regulator
MDGYQLAARLADNQPGLRVLFVEDAVYCRAVRRDAAQKAMCFLEKPFTMRDLAGKVRSVLDTPAARAVGAAI